MATLHVLQITDCHLFPSGAGRLLGVATLDSLQAVLEAACAERLPDAVVATGDIAEQPSPDTYRLFLATVRRYSDAPLLCVPGNHDHGATFAAELPTEDLKLGRWRLMGIDTHVDDVVGGQVAEGELRRLAAAPPGPTLVAGHHCPLPIGCAWLDAHRISNGAALLEAMAAGGVDAYVFGHIHQPFEGQSFERQPSERQRAVAGNRRMAVYGTPSTCFQFAVGSPHFAIDDASPGWRWLQLGAEGVRTAVRRADYALAIERHARPAGSPPP